MRILIATHEYALSQQVTFHDSLRSICLLLSQKGHEVEIFTLAKLDDPQTRLESQDEEGYRVHRLYMDWLAARDPFRSTYADPRIAQAIRRLLERNHYDLVHLIGGEWLGVAVVEAAKAHNLPLLLTLTDFWWMCYLGNWRTPAQELCSGPETDPKCAHCRLQDSFHFDRLSRSGLSGLKHVFESVSRTSSRAADALAAITHRRETLTHALSQVDLVISPSRFLIDQYARYGFDTQRFIHAQPHPAVEPATPVQPVSDALRLGFVGAPTWDSGIDLLIEAAQSLMTSQAALNLELCIPHMPDTDLGGKLKHQIAANPAIRWQVTHPSHSLAQLLSRFDALVVPSRSYENHGAIIHQARRGNLPVIAARIEPLIEWIDHERDGLLFELNDVAGLRAQILRLLEEPDLLPMLRQNIPSSPSLEDEARQFQSHYERLVRANGAG